ncbi:MAG: hypothetical protein IBJ01_03085 [Leptospira sp.]|uniref:Lipoprotein n=1 Tax=Leptospira paudalimensis TaxID=2950024 RepID=A0ABT3M9T5_9LEPT|nr:MULTISPECIES: hypothetical protein [Leptospira]MBL0953730.1 hypothetical protein [Leptospira sp.]MCW7505152.1 hypothetical protein [Leptospira paudalimensis]
MNFKNIFNMIVLLSLVSCAELPPLQPKEPKKSSVNLTLELIEPTPSYDNFILSNNQLAIRTIIRKGLIEYNLFKNIVNFNGDLQLRVLNNEKDEKQEGSFIDVRHKIKLTFILLKENKEIYKKDFEADEIATGSEKFIHAERVRYASEKAVYRCLDQFLEDISKQKL